MLIATLFKIVKILGQLRCPSESNSYDETIYTKMSYQL